VQAKASAENLSTFVRDSSRFPLTAYGNINTYALFAEHFRDIFNAKGRAGVIVPTGIATDFGTKDFFGDVVDQQQLASLYDFENREGLFEGVHRSYKFCLLTLSGTPVKQADFIFFATNTGHLRDPLRRFSLSPEEIARFNPNTRTMPVFRTRPDADLTRMIYEKVPVLDNEVTGENPWGVSFSTMFHMSNDSNLFVTEPGPDDVRLYEAKMFWHYDHRWATFENGDTRDVTNEEKANPNFFVNPRYWVSKKEVENKLEDWPYDWLVGFRDVTNATNERTSIFAIIQREGVGNNAPLMLFNSTISAKKITCITGYFSSLPFDFVCKRKIGGMHMNFYLVKQLPIISFMDITSNETEFILPRFIELTYTAWNLSGFSKKNNYKGPPYRWDQHRRALLRAELDAFYARLYGLNRKQLRYILDPADLTLKELEVILDPWEEVEDPFDSEGYAQRVAASTFPGETFRVLKEKEIKKYGEYRTRRLVLTAWERMQQAIDSGTEYVPMVDPPPAHPSMAHPWHDGTPYEGPGLVLDESLFEEEKTEYQPPAKKLSQICEPKPELSMEHKPEPIDWDLYKCQDPDCGQILAGFARYEHVRDEHSGVDPGFEKFKES
jgi:hypothetical protein